MHLPDVRTAPVGGSRVFLRTDCNVPLSQSATIEDDTRLRAGLPTITYLLSHGVQLFIAGHLGRPVNKYPISNFKFQISNEGKKYSLLPVALWLQQQLHGSSLQETKAGEFPGWQVAENVILLENLRCFEGEETNDASFAQKLAYLADVYINDSFDVAHRTHASVVGVPALLPHFAGLRFQEEVQALTAVLENPKRPLVVVIGGAKIETKLPLVSRMQTFAEHVLVGGKIAQEAGLELMEAGEKLVIGKATADGLDTAEESIAQFLAIIKDAKTVVWNGPIGKTGDESSERGTKRLAEAIIKSGAHTVVGGGDTLEFLRRNKLEDQFSFCSTGGGAMLAFLAGDKLPGLEALLV